MIGESGQPQLYLTIGDANFSDLFGGRKNCDGVFVARGLGGPDGRDECTRGASVVITSPPGSGKTLLACQMSTKSLLANDAKRVKTPQMPEDYWPAESLILYYTSDQSADEIASMCVTFGWLQSHQIALRKSLDATARAASESESLRPGIKMLITEMPHETSVDALWKHLQMNAGVKMNGRPAIVVVDAINNVMKVKDSYYLNFRELVKLTHDVGLPHVNLILVLEEDEKTRMVEEYVPQCVIRLGRGRGIAPSRTIEISKARHQDPLIGEHEFSVFPNKGGEGRGGIKIYPSVSSRARLGRHDPEKRGVRRHINFGNQQIDEKLALRPRTRLLSGSTTLIWGPPGTRKTDLCVEFAAAQVQEDLNSSVLLLTTKIDPDVFKVSFDEELGKRGLDVQAADHFFDVDARDPYRTPASTLAEVVDDIDAAALKGRPVKRAVIFGLSLLEETPSVRDDQWRFVSVLVGLLEAKNVATVLVDWPIEGVVAGDQANSRPRASKLCGTEIKMELGNKDGAEKSYPRIHLLRGNYTAIDAEIDYKDPGSFS